MTSGHAGSVHLRPATPGDLSRVCALLASASLPVAGVEPHLTEFIVAEDDAGLVGVIGRETYGSTALLRSAAVEPRVRGTGLGSLLVRELTERAKADGVRSLILLTTTAEQWFPRFGFVPITRDSVPVALRASEELRGACPASAVVMEKLL